jgi:hypothetical protein
MEPYLAALVSRVLVLGLRLGSLTLVALACGRTSLGIGLALWWHCGVVPVFWTLRASS